MTVVVTTDVRNGQTLNEDVINDNFGSVKTVVNGGLDNANFHTNTQIALTQMQTVTRRVHAGIAARTDPFALTPTGTTQEFATIIFPDDYVSGTPKIGVVCVGTVTEGNTAIMRYDISRYRSAATPVAIQTDAQLSLSGFTANQVFTSLLDLSDTPVAGDIYLFTFRRLGGDGSDTYTGTINWYATFLDYSGRGA